MTDLPSDNIFEVSLIGTGGYGESLVIHLGNQNWIVVDSCINPFNDECIPLVYLKNKGVTIESDVKLIICTHWHDDHIRGISELLRSCTSSKFCISRTTDSKKFLQFVGLDYNKDKFDTSISSTVEINNCFKILKERKIPILGAIQDKLIFSGNMNSINTSVFTLSPSETVYDLFSYEISRLITEYGSQNRKIVNKTPNEKSVALYITVNKHNILLGSDLEVSTSNKMGWNCILNDCCCINSPSSLFKIPHHGSKNGYHKNIWDNLLTSQVTAGVTTYNNGYKLPSNEMLEKYLTHTNNLFITSENYYSTSAKKRNPSISKVINSLNNTLDEARFKYGVIRFRINSLDENDKWQTDLFGEAKPVSSKNLQQRKPH